MAKVDQVPRMNRNSLPDFTQLISNIQEEPDLGGTSTLTFRFNHPNPRLLNFLYVAIQEHVETYAVEYVVYHVTQGCRTPEGLAHRIGLVPLKANSVRLDETGYMKERLDITAGDAHRPVYARDVDLPWVSGDEILIVLAPGERLVADLIVKAGTGAQHMKWRPICQWHTPKEVKVGDQVVGYEVTCTNIGQLPGTDILRTGVEKMFLVYDRKPESIYNKLAEP